MISEEFKQNVASGDLDTVRSALIDYLIIDRTFKSFDDALEYAKKSLNIIEPFNNEPLFSEEPWDRNYLNQQKVALMMNFSNKRIEHIKNVISKVLPVRTTKNDSVVHSEESPTQIHIGSRRTGSRVVSETPVYSKGTKEKVKSDTHNIGTALIVGGATVAVVGLAAVEPIVVGTGVVIAGVGVGVKAKNRR